MAKRTHKKKIEAERAARRTSPEQIRSAKCQACKLRNVERKAGRQLIAEERNELWSELSLTKQLEALDSRLGKGQGATKQRAKIEKKMENA
jgi:hypothetical protein